MEKCKIELDERFKKEFDKIFAKSKQAKASCREFIISWETKLKMLGIDLVKDEISKGDKYGMIETVDGSDYLYSLKIKKCKNKNIRILFLTTFEEKTKEVDYRIPQSRAEKRVKLHKKEWYVPCKKAGG